MRLRSLMYRIGIICVFISITQCSQEKSLLFHAGVGQRSSLTDIQKLFQERYPDELERNIWAEYEIAFTYYKMGNLEKAGELFAQLIARYDEENSENYPPGPRSLAEKVLEKIHG